MKKLRWTMDGQGFWELDVSTPTTLDGAASPVPAHLHLLPLGLSRGARLSRAKQIDFMQRFMAAPFVPSYAPSHGFSLQRVFPFPFPGSPTLLGQFNLQKFISSFTRSGVMHHSPSSFLQAIGRHLCHPSFYALGVSSDISLNPDDSDSLLISFDGYGENGMLRTKALLHHKFLHHDLTMEALSPGLFVDESGNYWDVPSSLLIDLGSAAFDSGPSYHLSMHHNAGSPSQSGTEKTGAVPFCLLPGLSLKAAFSFKHNFQIWRSNAKKLKMVQPYDIFLSNPHVSLSGIIGAVATTYFGDNSVRSAAQDSLQEFKGLNMQTSKIRSTVLADVFASISFSAQYGMFQRGFLDLTRFSASMDFHSGSKFISGAKLLIEDLSNSGKPRTETVKAILPDARFSLQQQIAGPISFRADSRVTIDLNKAGWGMQVEEPTFALEYALQVLGSAKAIAWYSPKPREFMVELRFYEN
ncbi:protein TRIGALACTOSYLDIACYLGLYCEROL 4, chloroplastic [Momordica charantia]|uniref:Protein TRIGALACTOSYLDIACYLGLYCEROL 4, chloroplastic n=1 Tax=Momordica charantia TaxID=3673 RepID=A0A6J1E1S3_MOMCH|nr:protein TRIGALACTOSYLDIACYLGLYCEROL 4, chloroplastic [Momordica charantia]